MRSHCLLRCAASSKREVLELECSFTRVSRSGGAGRYATRVPPVHGTACSQTLERGGSQTDPHRVRMAFLVTCKGVITGKQKVQNGSDTPLLQKCAHVNQCTPPKQLHGLVKE